MSDAKLDRVREDLAVMKQVVGLRQPCERDQLWTNLALAGLGVIIAVVTACTQGSTTPPVRGSLQHLASVAAIVVPGLIAVATLTAVSYRRREQAPVSWRENRQSGIVVAVITPLYVGFVVWAARQGVSASAISIATLFLFGLFMLVSAMTDRNRRFSLGWAVATMLAGAFAPLTPHAATGYLIGGWILLGGLLTAALVAWELRRGGAPDGHQF
ncbi:MAG TPA: hypothetical protein VGG64_08310 [Pirellulales bacterium]